MKHPGKPTDDCRFNSARVKMSEPLVIFGIFWHLFLPIRRMEDEEQILEMSLLPLRQ